ncbi:glycosyl transferase, partial [Streptococcus suis]
ENFDLISQALLHLLQKYPQVELHIVGYLDIPKPFQKFKKQIVSHEYVDWRKLPILISQVDINLAPLVTTTFNEAKSEIKWIEAAAVKVV